MNLHLALSCSLTILTFSSSAFGISPPPYFYWSHVQATIGRDPCITVRDLTHNPNEEYVLRMDICSNEKAQALNKVLRRDAGSSAHFVTVQVIGPDQVILPANPTCTPDSPADMELVYSQALGGNPLIASIYVASNSHMTAAWVEFKPAVVQVWVDNIGDRFGNNTYTAADAFAQVIDFNACGDHPSIRTTTSKVE